MAPISMPLGGVLTNGRDILVCVSDEMGGIEKTHRRTGDRWLTFQRIYLFILLASTIIVLNGCSVLKIIQDEDAGSELLDIEESTLICSEECQDRGQCGRDEEGSEFVLMNLASPVVEKHDRSIQANTPVTIVGEEIRSVILLSSSAAIDVPFYQVALPDGARAWVAGWCLGS
jgi:hypothetical protein